MPKPEYTFLRKEEIQDPAVLRRKGVIYNLIGKAGQYITFLYGVYAVSRETPEVWKAAVCGAGFLAAGYSEYIGHLFGFKAESERVRETEEEINSRLGLLERKASGRVINAKVDPNFSKDTKLDEMVRADVEKDIGLLPGERAEADTAKETFPKGDTNKIIKPSGWKK